jgi:hypothetical protein
MSQHYVYHGPHVRMQNDTQCRERIMRRLMRARARCADLPMLLPRSISLCTKSIAACDQLKGVIAMRMRVKWYVVRYLTKGIGGRRRRRRKVLAGKLTFRLSSTHCQKIMHIAYQCGDPIGVSFHCSKVLMYHCFYYRQDPSPCS